jgi:hypothetical protein
VIGGEAYAIGEPWGEQAKRLRLGKTGADQQLPRAPAAALVKR